MPFAVAQLMLAMVFSSFRSRRKSYRFDDSSRDFPKISGEVAYLSPDGIGRPVYGQYRKINEDKNNGSTKDQGRNQEAPENPISSGPYKKTRKSNEAKSHKLRKIRLPSRCHVCETQVLFRGVTCTECSMVCHRRCLQHLAIQCGHGKCHLFGEELSVAARDTSDGVPSIIKECTSEVEKRALTMEGIYRISGVKSRVDHLCSLFESAKDLADLSAHDPHDICGALKSYLRQLPEPLVIFQVYDDLIRLAQLDMAAGACPAEENSHQMRRLLERLPEGHYNTLRHLIGHLHRVASVGENKMGARNLAIIFGHTLLRKEKEDVPNLEQLPFQAHAVQMMIDSYEKIF
ncbi:rho GTPase-activating protein 29-like [Rhinophrynus dorsalis]